MACGAWIRRPENQNLVVICRSSRRDSSPAVLELFSFDSVTTSLSSSPLVSLCFSLSISFLFVWLAETEERKRKLNFSSLNLSQVPKFYFIFSLFFFFSFDPCLETKWSSIPFFFLNCESGGCGSFFFSFHFHFLLICFFCFSVFVFDP